jgi:hypothetical protein
MVRADASYNNHPLMQHVRTMPLVSVPGKVSARSTSESVRYSIKKMGCSLQYLLILRLNLYCIFLITFGSGLMSLYYTSSFVRKGTFYTKFRALPPDGGLDAAIADIIIAQRTLQNSLRVIADSHFDSQLEESSSNGTSVAF